MAYTLYIDESGETGIKKVRTDTEPGASPYFSLGSVLVRDDNKDHLLEVLDGVAATFGRDDLHSSRLKHRHKVYFSRALAEQEVVLFGIISKKSTLAEYAERIGADNVKYFNKCAIYLLECVGEFMQEHGIAPGDLTVTFEEGHHDYGRFRSYLGVCQDSPFHRRARFLRNIDLGSVIDRPKLEEPLLKFADMTAHAIYQTVNKSDDNLGITEMRYLSELHPRFYCDSESKKICPKGLKPIRGLARLDMDREDQQAIQEFEGQLVLPRVIG